MPQINIDISKKVFLPVYQPYIEDYSKRYNVYYGGRGSGKTKFILQKLLIKGLKEKRLILLMRKQTNKLRDSVWKEALQVIEEFKLTAYFDVNKTEFRITCNINGTEFKCLGLDEPEKIKGFANISDVLLDEVTEFTPEDIELIDGTLRSQKYNLPLQIYFAFNPISKANFVYKYFGFDTGIAPDNTFIIKTTYLDNPYLDESYKARMEALKQRNYNRWCVEAMGNFVSLDKLVYTNWKQGVIDNIDGWALICGLDFGYINDASAFICSYINTETKQLYIFKEHYEHHLLNDAIAAMIIYKGFGKEQIIADSAEQKSIEEIKRLGVPRIKAATKGKGSILQGIQKIQQYDITVNPECENTIIELENYSWIKDKITGEYINTPIDSYNHCLDALRYSLQCLDNQQKLKTLNKSLLGL